MTLCDKAPPLYSVPTNGFSMELPPQLQEEIAGWKPALGEVQDRRIFAPERFEQALQSLFRPSRLFYDSTQLMVAVFRLLEHWGLDSNTAAYFENAFCVHYNGHYCRWFIRFQALPLPMMEGHIGVSIAESKKQQIVFAEEIIPKTISVPALPTLGMEAHDEQSYLNISDDEDISQGEEDSARATQQLEDRALTNTELLFSHNLSDVAIHSVVDDKFVPAHKDILATQSEVFEHESAYKQEGGKQVIHWEHGTEVILEFLSFAYTGEINQDFLARHLYTFREIALEYQMEGLLLKTIEALSASLTTETVAEHMIRCHQSNYEDLLEICLLFLTLNTVKAAKETSVLALECEEPDLWKKITDRGILKRDCSRPQRSLPPSVSDHELDQMGQNGCKRRRCA